MNQIQKSCPLYDLLAYSNKQSTELSLEPCSSSKQCCKRRPCSECSLCDIHLLCKKLGCFLIGEVLEVTHGAGKALNRKFVELTPEVDLLAFRTFLLFSIDKYFAGPFMVVIVAPTGHFLSVNVNQTARLGLLHDAASIRKVDCDLNEILCACWSPGSWRSFWTNWVLVDDDDDGTKLKLPNHDALPLVEVRKFFDNLWVWEHDGKGGVKKSHPVDVFLESISSNGIMAVVPTTAE